MQMNRNTVTSWRRSRRRCRKLWNAGKSSENVLHSGVEVALISILSFMHLNWFFSFSFATCKRNVEWNEKITHTRARTYVRTHSENVNLICRQKRKRSYFLFLFLFCCCFFKIFVQFHFHLYGFRWMWCEILGIDTRTFNLGAQIRYSKENL